MADYKGRTHASQYNSAVTSGFACDFIHLTGGAQVSEQIPARSAITLLSINVAPGSGSVSVSCGNDIVMEASIARDYKMGWYAYNPVTVSIPDGTADVTIYFAPPPKGAIYG